MTKATLLINSLMLAVSLWIMMQFEREETARTIHAATEAGIPANIPLTHTDEYRHRRFECIEAEEYPHRLACLSWHDPKPLLTTA